MIKIKLRNLFFGNERRIQSGIWDGKN